MSVPAILRRERGVELFDTSDCLERLSMSLVTTTSAAANPGMIATILVGVLAFSAFLAWMAWWQGSRAYKFAVRLEQDPRYLRRRLFRRGMIYVGCTVLLIVFVATGEEPKESLLIAPIGIAFAWFKFKAAFRVKVPPA